MSFDNEVWKDVVVAKYGGGTTGSIQPGLGYAPSIASRWWVDICNLDKDSNWFVSALVKKVGSGNNTKFWSDIWVGEQPLRDRFPRLFGISNQKEDTIASMGGWNDFQWVWNLEWRRQFFEWEQPLYQQLIQIIAQFQPTQQEDMWQWRENVEDGFTVKSCYDLLHRTFNVIAEIGPLKKFVFSNIWRCAAPSKVCAFSWQLLLERIPTKDNLWKRRMLLGDQLSCVFCNAAVETPTHLFLHCPCVSKIWYAVMKWLGLILISPPNIETSMAVFAGCAREKVARAGLILVWNSVMWVVWKMRNDCIFNNKVVVVEDMVEQVQLLSWRWFLNRKARGPCMLYEWKWCPFECFQR
jgi:hypothetical protein